MDIEKGDGMLRPITRLEHDELAASDDYFGPHRWAYYKVAIDLAMSERPKRVLELGPYKLPLFHDCDVMDIRPELGAKYEHDGNITPWPVADKFYDVFLGLQVWEHLDYDPPFSQRRAFEEVRRVSRCAILSFPYLWHRPKNQRHHMIDSATIESWTNGHRPSIRPIMVPSTGKNQRIIYLWHFGD